MKRILTPANCMGIYEAGVTGLLVDSCDYYRAFHHAALTARHYILLSGWQFDTDVKLLRGKDAAEAGGDVRFLPFLQSLCEKTPQLQVFILAWDFSMIFSMEREWFQHFIFNWSSNKRIRFRFDSKHPVGATHHQKFVIVDGHIAFVGGMDICSSRWDDRHHLQENPERKDIDGVAYGAYHDIQSYHTGPVVKELITLFERRWTDSGGDPLLFPTTDHHKPYIDKESLPLATDRVAISRTHIFQSLPGSIREIRRLFIDAIMAAEELIYMENQYFSSQAVYSALVSRMTAPDRPRLQIVMILPDRLPFTEELFLGVPQMKMLRSLRKVAEKTGNRLGVYSTACIKDGERRMTFVHSKLLLVDDRFLTVGSANATNRSMGLDTELNVSWEAEPTAQPDLVASIRRVRVSLLAEHAGVAQAAGLKKLARVEGLISHLDHLAGSHHFRLCHYLPESSLENGWSEILDPIAQVVDPEKPIDDEYIFEYISKPETSFFAKGILILSQWVAAI